MKEAVAKLLRSSSPTRLAVKFGVTSAEEGAATATGRQQSRQGKAPLMVLSPSNLLEAYSKKSKAEGDDEEVEEEEEDEEEEEEGGEEGKEGMGGRVKHQQQQQQDWEAEHSVNLCNCKAVECQGTAV